MRCAGGRASSEERGESPFFMPVCLFFIVGGWVGGRVVDRACAYIYNPEPEPEPEKLACYHVI
jgi:hypothetical protein